MRKITVNASRTYDILIGKGLLDNAGQLIAEVVKSRKAAIITDDIVDGLYGDRVAKALENSGFTTVKFVFKNGEASKCHDTLIRMYDFLAESDITRTDLLIALGGGVVGDITGYCAATFLRGVDFIQIPTTLLAQVDSSVGGKTAVNIKAGKNLVGAFYQPLRVIADINALNTLSDEIFADGMGEVVKYGMIRSEELFHRLSAGRVKADLEEIVAQCVEIKKDVVQRDEHDIGERMILNFGHTFGHAVEKYYNYTGISHGKGVALGMYHMTLLSEKAGYTKQGTAEKLLECLCVNHLPYELPLTSRQIYDLSVNDKKRASDKIRIVVCPEIGSTQIVTLTLGEYGRFLEG